MLLMKFVCYLIIIAMILPYKLLKKEIQRYDCFKEYLDYVKSVDKHDKCLLRISFLERCRDSDITPKFLNFRIPKNGCFDDQSVQKFQRGLLHKEIGKARSVLTNRVSLLEEKRCALRDKIPYHCLPSVVVYSRLDRIENRKIVVATHVKKLKELSLRQQKPLFNVSNTVKICNVSKTIPNYVMQTLAMGPRNPVMEKFDEKEVLVELDCFLKFCKEHHVADSAITDLNIKTLNYIKTCKKQKTPRHVSMTKEFLKENDLLAVPFDKGIGYCIMPRETYEKKLEPIINLPQFEKYVDGRKNAKHPILKEEDRVTDVLRNLKNDGKISETLFNELKPVGSQAPRLYGLAKIHKDGTPLRPIVSMPGSAYQRVAKKVASWLAQVPECNINTSPDKIAKQLPNIKLSENESLISFDVSSLYTNVPVKESIEVCADLLFNRVSFDGIDKETFIKLAELACCNVVFSTHLGYYVQKDGLAMGSPPAPHLANGWLSTFDNVIKGESEFFERYMDDILRTVKNDEVDTELNRINNLHPCLSFTSELEIDGKIPFLDMLILNSDGILSSSWYRKPTDTGLTLNYHALAPVKYKKSVVISFIHRIFRACSTWKNFHLGISEAIRILENNQYPTSFIMPIIKNTIDKLVAPSGIDTDISSEISFESSLDSNACLNVVSDRDKFKFSICYRGKPTEQLAKSFRKMNAPCQIIMTTIKTRNALPSLKPAVPKMLRSNVVYKIDCPGCDSSYVGQTVRHLQRRFREHIGNKGPMKTHFECCKINNPSDDIITILDSSNSLPRLLTLEALYINQHKPSLNTKDEYRSRTLTLKF